jgi:hypothetical protein
MVPKYPNLKLDAASRLNYAKIYTIEYNVKVRFIGRIHPDSFWQVAADYNAIHPQLIEWPGGGHGNSSYGGGSNHDGPSNPQGYGGSASGYGGSSVAGASDSATGYGGYSGRSDFSNVSTTAMSYSGTSQQGSSGQSYYGQPRTTPYTLPYRPPTQQGGNASAMYPAATVVNTSLYTTGSVGSTSMYPAAHVGHADPEDTQQDRDEGPPPSHYENYDRHDDIYDD